MTAPHAFLIAYAFIGCVYWLWMLVGAVRIVRAVPVLGKAVSPAPAAWPRLSIVIPACNEGESLEAAIATVLGQDYPDLEVVLVDDRSTDATGAIIDRVATADCRVRVVHVTQLPEGWLGKVHALARGVEKATGDWLLFADADVHLAPVTLRRAIAYCLHRRVDHVAALPDIWYSSLVLDTMFATFLRTFPVATRCWAVADADSGAYIGVGAFNLVRREALEATEGLSWLRLEVADDLGLGLLLKRSGARCCVVNGTGVVGLHWYRNLGQVARGVEKAYAPVAGCNPLRMLGVCAAIIGLEWAPIVALLPLGVPGLFWAGLLMAVAAVASTVIMHRWLRHRLLPGLLAPAGVVLGVLLFLRAGWLGFRRGGVVWRGTLYPSRQLRSGARVRFP
jgi:cellulose synthase/poly-beta-1,6-N-acetylglucosamine synthase-like glycosyltransferase